MTLTGAKDNGRGRQTKKKKTGKKDGLSEKLTNSPW